MPRLGRFIPWLIGLTITLALVAGYVMYQRQADAAALQAERAALRTEKVKRGNLVARVSASGTILPEQQTNLFFLVPGTIAEVFVKSGDTVAAGQIVARLDDTQPRLAVQQAADALAMAELSRELLLAGPNEADIAVARANLRSAHAAAGDLQAGASEADEAIAQIRYDSAQANFRALNDQYNSLTQLARDNPLFAPAPETLSALKATMEQAFYAAEVARLQLAQAQAGGNRGQISVAYAQVLQAQAVLSQTLAPPTALQIEQAALAVEQAASRLERARLAWARTELAAPYAGVIASVEARPGELATPSLPLMVLLDTSRFHLDVSVDEVDVAQLAADQPVAVQLEALSEMSLTGQVERVAPTATASAGLVNYTVRLLLNPTDAGLRAGMSATADIVVAEVQDAVLLPNWAIRRDRRTGQAYASLQQGEGLMEVPITTGLRGESYTEVLSGVEVGAVAAISTAREGIDLLGGD